MRSLLSIAALFGLLLQQSFVAASPLPPSDTPRYFERDPTTRLRLTSAQVQKELGPVVSKETVIFGPDSTLYPNATSRWVTYVRPDIKVVVQPAKESDVATIVKYCNANSIDFLARNRGHGLTTSLNAFSGMEIDLSLLRGATVNKEKQTALLLGGSYAGPTIQTLWDQGYVTSTGAATCVGLMGVALGGGHGRLESLYGLVGDGLVHLNAVLADGSTIGINSTSHSDLFWAMKGAGHNFAIITSYEVKIYPQPATTWHYHNYTWTGDKVKRVFTELNKLHTSANGTTPVRMAYEGGSMSLDPSISTTKAILSWSFAYNGPAQEAEKLLAPFNAIGSVHEEVGDVPYIDIPDIQGTSEDGPACQDAPYVVSSNMLLRYNVTTQQAMYDQFNQYAAKYPQLGAGTRISFEGYANKAVQAIDSASTAYPHRDQNHIVYFLGAVPDSTLFQAAQAWAKATWTLWNEGKESRRPDTYVNYAAGQPYESIQSVYGYESWRLQRLMGLKAKYDPHNRFRWFVPV
ncbi:FAD-binding domain-containing protein [Xylaria sp. CBS 124048]|nr:FAD-binding domain-containing protein [Xylaria sp. CBS 124048]